MRLVTLPEQDVRLFEVPDEPIHGILAAPPCTEFAASGARWWGQKEARLLVDALSVVDACLRIIWTCSPTWWALENPVGRLNRFIGEPYMTFNPCDYGDPWTKRTLLWGDFNVPEKNPVEPTMGSICNNWGGKSEHTKQMRSITPPGFARAFYEANP